MVPDRLDALYPPVNIQHRCLKTGTYLSEVSRRKIMDPQGRELGANERMG
jgi:hypothetical protein